jgi:hypothetical protein
MVLTSWLLNEYAFSFTYHAHYLLLMFYVFVVSAIAYSFIVFRTLKDKKKFSNAFFIASLGKLILLMVFFIAYRLKFTDDLYSFLAYFFISYGLFTAAIIHELNLLIKKI